jgi:replication factor C large subunit
VQDARYGGAIYPLETLDDIVGNAQAVSALRMFASDFERGIARAPLLLFGPSGIGKSASAHLLAKESNWNMVELNAGDYRDKESIDRNLLAAATSRSVFGNRNMILVDEVDELAASADRGASGAISNLVSSAKNPVILIANDRWDQRISFLRGKTDPVEFKRLRADETAKVLENYARFSALETDRSSIDIIAARANGDARSAINDLYVSAGSGSEMMEVIGMRDRKVDIFNLLDKIFFANTIAAPLRAIGGTDLNNDMLMRWLDENIPNRYTDSDDLARAFGMLSEASAYSTKAMRSQYYTYWRYMKVLMSSGIALSKTRYPSTAKRYSFPKVIKELSLSKSSRRQDAKIAERLQRKLHSSVRRILANEMRVIALMASKSVESGTSKKEVADYLARSYGLDDGEAEALAGGG